MATLDISIIFFALVVDMILLIMAIGMRSWLFSLMSAVFGMSSLGYFITNYTAVAVGTFTIPFVLFDIAWAFLCIIVPLVLIINSKYRLR